MADNPCRRMEVIVGDITTFGGDAIVNAANERLLGSGGVDGAIHQAAGPELLAECRTLGGCRTGEAKSTKGYGLPARWVIHTVGPIWQGGDKGEATLLADAYCNSLREALRIKAAHVAFPAISTGVYGYPPKDAAAIAITSTGDFLAEHPAIRKVTFVCFSHVSEREHLKALRFYCEQP